jgi:hypothetical protein
VKLWVHVPTNAKDSHSDAEEESYLSENDFTFSEHQPASRTRETLFCAHMVNFLGPF